MGGCLTRRIGNQSLSPPVLSFIEIQSSITAGSSRTFTMSFSTAAADRRLFVVIQSIDASNNHSITAVTIGGIAATIHEQRSGGAGNSVVAIASALVPTGTSGNVVITFNASCSIQCCGIYKMTGGINSAPDFTGGANSNVGSFSLSYNANSVVVCGGIDWNTDNVPAHTMTGTGITHDAIQFRGATTAMLCGHGAFSSASSVTISMSNVEGTADKLAGLSWS